MAFPTSRPAPTADVIVGDARAVLASLAEGSAHACITSPPYYGLRDYSLPASVWGGNPDCQHRWGGRQRPLHPGQIEQTRNRTAHGAGAAGRAATGQFCQGCSAWLGQLGLEPTPELYVEHLVEVCRAIARVLRPDATLWLNLGDSYGGTVAGLCKQLLGIPWRVALALQADGWYLRQWLPWVKRAAMPESVTSRPGAAIETVFLLTRSARPQFWTHPEKPGRRRPPPADYAWRPVGPDGARDQQNRGDDPRGRKRRCSPAPAALTDDDSAPGSGGRPQYRRVNLWRAHDYYYDPAAVSVPATGVGGKAAGFAPRAKPAARIPGQAAAAHRADRAAPLPSATRNRRNSDWWFESLDVWIGEAEEELAQLRRARASGAPLAVGDRLIGFHANPRGFPGAHFATYPAALIAPMVAAATSEAGCCAACGAPYARARTPAWRPTCECAAGLVPCLVLDPFNGSGTTGLAALAHGASYLGIDLSAEYARMSRGRWREAGLIEVSAGPEPPPSVPAAGELPRARQVLAQGPDQLSNVRRRIQQ